MIKNIIIIFFIFLIVIFGLYFYNYNQLQSKMNNVINEDPRNNGIIVNVHFEYYFKKSVLIYNLKSVANDKAKVDVFRVLLQFSEKMKDNHFDQIFLSFRGNKKFQVEGKYFKTLGEEYSWQNPVYTMRTFPENLMYVDNSNSYPEWTGGLLGVSNKQM